MKKYILSILFVLFSFNLVIGQTERRIIEAKDELNRLINLVKVQQQLQWNRYETANFEILSIDDGQGRYLYENIENIKKWIFTRWGMQDISFSKKCMIICVPDFDLFEKLFSQKGSSFKCDPSGSQIWLVTKGNWKAPILPPLLTEVCLYQFELYFNVKFGVWVHRGMSQLNRHLQDIRNDMEAAIEPQVLKYDAKTLFNITPTALASLSQFEQGDYEIRAAVFCLFLKKEFAKHLFLDFVDQSRTDPKKALTLLGFSDYTQLDVALKTYSSNLRDQIINNIVPQSYFNW